MKRSFFGFCVVWFLFGMLVKSWDMKMSKSKSRLKLMLIFLSFGW